MLFHSYAFLFFFLPLVVGGFHALQGQRPRLLFLAAASFVFYAWWNLAFALFLLGFCVANYRLGNRLHSAEGERLRRLLLIALLVLDLGVLAFFKYHPLLTQALSALGLPSRPMGIVLPIAISFYTFQGVSYAVDLYRRRIEPARGLLEFACFKFYFPQLIAGPIVRFHEIAGQLGSLRTDWDAFARGVILFCAGLGKKVLIADTLARTADAAFGMGAGAGGFQGIDAYLALVCFAFQIYFDFSAYSDMACGLSLMFGVELPRNFDSPYQARSLSDFWRRWHITLSSWLRDYLYIPLGGSRQGKARMYLALLATMLLGGLWHGASYTFAAWGLIHGLILCLEKGLGERNPLRRLPAAAQVFVTFHLVMAAWVFFRCPEFGQAMGFFRDLAAWETLRPVRVDAGTIILLAACAPVIWAAPNLHRMDIRLNPAWASFSLAGLAMAVAVLMGRAPSPFLYFQF